MSEEFVLVVSDESDGKHGEISVLDTAHEAEHLVETLLESGIDQNRIRVFAGAEAEFETVYRPVVSLFDEANETAELDRPVSDKAGVKAHSGNGHSRGSVRPSSLFRSARDDDAIDVYISASEAAS
jgi:hypothetical protein